MLITIWQPGLAKLVRIDAGEMDLHRRLCDIDEIITAALKWDVIVASVPYHLKSRNRGEIDEQHT